VWLEWSGLVGYDAWQFRGLSCGLHETRLFLFVVCVCLGRRKFLKVWKGNDRGKDLIVLYVTVEWRDKYWEREIEFIKDVVYNHFNGRTALKSNHKGLQSVGLFLEHLVYMQMREVLVLSIPACIWTPFDHTLSQSKPRRDSLHSAKVI